jgi:hypothetical protein
MGGWSTTAIGKFYNGRDHSTVCHAITRIEFLRRSDQGVTAIIDGLAHACEQEDALASNGSGHLARLHRLDPVLGKTGSGFIDQLANGIAPMFSHVWTRRSKLEQSCEGRMKQAPVQKHSMLTVMARLA